MKRTANIVALAVVIAMGASSLVAQSLLSHAQPLERPAGCHEHGSKAPAQRPASSECCAIGHNAALPQASHSIAPILLNTRIEFVADAPVNLLPSGKGIFSPAGDPPGSTPLRI